MGPKDNRFTAATSLLFIAKLFIKRKPSKLIIECILSAANQILVVINSVWLLECLMDMILDQRTWPDALKVLAFIVSINIVVSIVQNFYHYCVRPQGDLEIKKQYLEEYLMDHGQALPLSHYEDSTFYTTVKRAQNAVSDTVFAAYSDLIQISGNAAVAAAIHRGTAFLYCVHNPDDPDQQEIWAHVFGEKNVIDILGAKEAICEKCMDG